MLARKLVRWFARQARDLPWRHTRDPYPVWVAEIMLQQTQVKTVIPYWQRWMRALPDLESLARARPRTVLKLWEGLGYYRRALNLHRAARAMVHAGSVCLPGHLPGWLEVPGVGRYTAGAICSIAFNQPHPVLDGNVIRVLARLRGWTDPPGTAAGQDKFWRLARKLVEAAAAWGASARPPGRSAGCKAFRDPWVIGFCSALNQSLMELGATVCTPRAPRCAVCPLAGCCTANARGIQHRLPSAGKTVRPTRRRVLVLVLQQRDRFLVRQRSALAINARLWEFPRVERGDQSAAESLAGLCRELRAKPSFLGPLLRIQHSITRYRIEVEAWQGRVERRGAPGPGRWLTLAQIRRLPFPAAERRIIAHLDASNGRRRPSSPAGARP